MDKSGGGGGWRGKRKGVSHFFVEKLLFHSAKKLRSGTLLCFVSKKLPVVKKFMDKKA